MHLTLGADGEAVQQLQELLAERGYDVGEIDREYGRRTRDAVASFQREQGLEPTRSVGPDTAEELDLDVDFDMPAVPPERAKYKQLLAENPNYFGNHPELEYEPVLDITSNTDFEELTCVGYDPAAEQLETVVSVKRDHGYGGDLCTDGSVEFVRFSSTASATVTGRTSASARPGSTTCRDPSRSRIQSRSNSTRTNSPAGSHISRGSERC